MDSLLCSLLRFEVQVRLALCEIETLNFLKELK